MLKPWPIGWFDRQVGGGFGIMLDDIIAAILLLLSWLPLRTGYPHYNVSELLKIKSDR